MISPSKDLPVAVIGAGPVGMAAAAQLAVRGLPFVVFETGDQLAASVRDWAHVRVFSPWRYDTDSAARQLLEEIGWVEPDPQGLPTGAELVEQYLDPLAAHPAIAPSLRFGAAVTAIARRGMDKVRTAGREAAPFVLRLSDGGEVFASAVIDASGTWRSPNPLGGNGLTVPGEAAARSAGRVFDGMPDVTGWLRAQFAGRQVAVVGSGHSAMGTLLGLADLPETTVQWVVRVGNPSRAYGGGDADALPARGAIGIRLRALVDAGTVTVHTGFFVHQVTDAGLVSADGRTVEAEVIVNATGQRPDHTMASELRLDLDPILGCTRALAPLIDPNQHSCGTVPPHGVDELAQPEPGFFVVGAKSYGRAPTFLLATGYEQARSVVAALAGDWAAARDVRLELPETGVCSSDFADGDGAACCGSASAATVSRGLATGVAGGRKALDLVGVAASDASGGCCG
jgi:thioredoxin reductase